MKKYIDEKYGKYKVRESTQAHLIWAIKHMKTALPKQYNEGKYSLSKDIRTHLCSFLKCNLSYQLDAVINKLENKQEITEKDMRDMQRSAQEFEKLKNEYVLGDNVPEPLQKKLLLYYPQPLPYYYGHSSILN